MTSAQSDACESEQTPILYDKRKSKYFNDDKIPESSPIVAKRKNIAGSGKRSYLDEDGLNSLSSSDLADELPSPPLAYRKRNSKSSNGMKKRLKAMDSDESDQDVDNNGKVPEELKIMFPDRTADELSMAFHLNSNDVQKTCDYLFHSSHADSPPMSNSGRPDKKAALVVSSPVSSTYNTKSKPSKRSNAAIIISDDECEEIEFKIPTKKSDTSSAVIELSSDLVDASQSEDDIECNALEFFNSASTEEMAEMIQPSTMEQASALVALRPFTTYQDLNDRLYEQKGLNLRILENYFENVRLQDVLNKLTSKCLSISQDISQELRKWTLNKPKESKNYLKSEPNSDEDEETGIHYVEFSDSFINDDNEQTINVIKAQPPLINSELQLKNYQMLGINWMWLLHQKNLSGILADEMGLGKTAQVISFLSHLLSSGIRGPYLIVVPSSTIGNWVREIDRWCPALSTVMYSGSQQERFELRNELLQSGDFHIILTTYNIVSSTKDDRSFLRRCKFHYLILDEGHMVKNTTSQRYKHLTSINTPYRLLLTGTPLQNNLQELMALLIFIMPSLFAGEEEILNSLFSLKIDQDSPKWKTLVQKAKIMMAPFILRRKKSHVLKDLPQKKEEVIYCDATPYQMECYKSLLLESRKDYNELEQEQTGKRNKKPTKNMGIRLNNILMQLRKMACHPLLHRKQYTDKELLPLSKTLTREEQYWDSDPNLIYEDLTYLSDFEIHTLCSKHKGIKEKYCLDKSYINNAGKVQKLMEILPGIRKSGGRILLFSQFTMVLDIIEQVFTNGGFSYKRMDGSTPVNERQTMIDEYQRDDSIFAFLLSTKAGGFGINLTAANYVILYDLDFNPHNDAQAEDRAHRVGQTRDVTVIKLITKDTIEEQIYKCAVKKLKLDKSIQSMGADDASDKKLPAVDLTSLMDMLKAELVNQ